jgi:hypothetical protein
MIQPGQTEKVEFSAPTPQKSGPFGKEITVASNDRNTPTLTLHGESNVLTALHKQPEVVNFAQIKRDTPEQKQTVTITRGDGGPLKLHVSSIGNPQIKTDLREIEAGEKYELDVTISPPWPNGMLQGPIVLDTGVEQVPLETIHVFASVAPRLVAMPPRFMLQAAPASELSMTARLTWDGTPGKILDVTTTDPATKVELVGEKDQQDIVLHVPAGYNPANKNGNISVRTDDPVVPLLQIPVTVILQPMATPGQPTTLPGRVIPPRVSGQPPTTKPAGTTAENARN